MDMEAFLAQSPSAAQVQAHLAGATLALGHACQCLADPRAGEPTTADLRQHLFVAIRALQHARLLVPQA
jgi:hypothetical protein